MKHFYNDLKLNFFLLLTTDIIFITTDFILLTTDIIFITTDFILSLNHFYYESL